MKPENIQPFGFRLMTVADSFLSFFCCAATCSAGLCNKWILACAIVMFALFPFAAHADETGLDVEAPQVRALLSEAMILERTINNPSKIRRAASLYCKASRLGSIEAQYRLGLFYLSGKGVQENRDFASVLFSQAAQQGHAQALDMLEGMRLRTLKLPPCLV